MKQLDLVSIVMPAYNAERYIEASVDSVINQTYRNWELIIIDDCSKDSTASIAQKYTALDNRIRYYKNEKNSGVSVTRNKGVELASGKWIAFLDSDDLWDKEKLEKQLKFLVEKDAAFVFTGSSFIDEDGKPYSTVFHVPQRVDYRRLLRQNVISCSSVVIQKPLIHKYKMENDQTHEDFGSWLRILKNEAEAFGIDEPLLIYRISRRSKSGNKLKSLSMAYKTYRFAGLGRFMSCYYMCWYIINGVLKYRRIFASV